MRVHSRLLRTILTSCRSAYGATQEVRLSAHGGAVGHWVPAVGRWRHERRLLVRPRQGSTRDVCGCMPPFSAAL